MTPYKQLIYEQRCQIEVLKKSDFTQKEISATVGVSQSTISRELRRNTVGSEDTVISKPTAGPVLVVGMPGRR
jgi:transposase, IS30 family